MEAKKREGISRRQWLQGTGTVALALTAAHLGGVLPAARAEQPGLMSQWPWPYAKLDPTTTAEIAYEEWYRLYCGGAVISSVFSQLREKIGEPYLSFPIDGFVFLEGGRVNWGTICGSNAGAAIVANLITGPRSQDEYGNGQRMASDIFDWYSNTAMPVFIPKAPRVPVADIPHTISESPLCHISVGKWMAVSEKPVGSPERKDRCARTAASVAYRLVELLNEWHDEDYDEYGEWRPVTDTGINAQQNCMECHAGGVPQAPRKADRS